MRVLLTFMSVLAVTTAVAQAVPKNIVAEHFTNTYCSVCASNNPGFYSNLNNFPQVLHVSYYPSAPYAACPLNQHNKTENDARANFYSVYGATPKLVVQGKVVSGALTNATIFQNELGQTSSFEMKVIMKEVNVNLFEVRVVVKKKDTSTATGLNIYAAVVEDTLFYNANNGENIHYNVFRKSVWGTQPIAITVPAAIGDSVVQTQILNYNSVWNKNRLYTVAILQSGSKNVLQASISNHVSGTTGIENHVANTATIRLTPNPVADLLMLEGINTGVDKLVVVNLLGESKELAYIHGEADVSMLSKGIYTLLIYSNSTMSVVRFVKN